MTISIHRIWFIFLALIFLFCVGAAAWYQIPWIGFLPLVPLAFLFFLQQPLYLFYLLIFSIPWSIEFNITPQLGTDLPDEPLMWMTSLVSIILLAHHQKKISIQRIHPLFILILLEFLWLGCTVFTSTDVFLSTKFLLAKSWYMLAFVAAPYFFFQDTKVFQRTVVLLLISMLGITLVTLERHAFHGMAFGKINDSLQPFFRNHVNYSALLVFMVPIQVAVYQVTDSKKIRAVIICMVTITCMAIYFSYARGAWLALATGLCAYWLIRKKILLFSFLLLVALCITAAFYFSSQDRYLRFSNDKHTIFHTDLREHLRATYTLKDLSNGERFYRWVAGIRMIGDHWTTGWGPATFDRQYKNYTIPSFKTYVSKNEEHSTVHNYFLLVLIEQGVMGLWLFLALLGSLFWYIEKIYNRTTNKFWKIVMIATGVILVMQCTVNFLSDLIETDKIGSVFFLCVTIVALADKKTGVMNSA